VQASNSKSSPGIRPTARCVILGAGISSRLRPITDDIPKCLVRVGEKTLLQRTYENLRAVGIRDIAVVVGYKRDAVRVFLKSIAPPMRVRLLVNPKFDSTNNAFSLLLARDFYRGAESTRGARQPLLFMDGDILFSPLLLTRLIEESNGSAVAVRVSGPHDDEEVSVSVASGNVIRMIGKNLPRQQSLGESVGIHLFAPPDAELLFKTLEQRVRDGDGRTEYYESAIQEMIGGGTVIRAVDTSEFPAAEIDTPEDLAYAEEKILPLLRHA